MNLGLRQRDFLRQGIDPIVNIDPEVTQSAVKRNGPRSMTAPALRLMEVSGWSCPPQGATATAEVDGTYAVVRQLPADERGRHVERVLLPRTRRPKPTAHAAAHRDHVGQPDARRELAIRRRAEVLEMLKGPDGRSRPSTGRQAALNSTSP